MSYAIKQGDRLPVLDATITKADGTALDLSTALSITFRMRNVNARPTGAFVVEAPATIVDAVSGRVRYSWASGDSNTPGQYAGEFVVVFPGPLQQTVPTSGYLSIVVVDAGLPG